MKAINFIFEIHQPFRLKRYRFFDIGNDHYYYDLFLNEDIVSRIAHQSYIPAAQTLLRMIEETKGKFRCAIAVTGVALEQFGYGLGFTAYSLFLVYFSKGEKSTSVFSICTAVQALGMMLPGMFAGKLADMFGFLWFFVIVVACCTVTFVVSALVSLPRDTEGSGQ